MDGHVLVDGECVTCRPGSGHVFDNGVCVTCRDARRARVRRRFDPNQVRDPHTGKWVDTTPGVGGLATWMHDVVRVADGAVTVGAGEDDHVLLSFGEAHTSLSADSGLRFAEILRELGGENDSLRIGGTRHLADYPPDDQYASPIGFASVKRTGRDEYAIELLSSDKTLKVSAAEANRLGATIDRAAASRKVDTSQGPFAAVLGADKRITTRWPSTAGKPVTIEMSAGEAEKLQQAIKDGIDQLDDPGLRPNPDKAIGPNDVLMTRNVKLGNGQLTMKVYGDEYGKGVYEFGSDLHDWSLRLPDIEAEKFVEALSAPVDAVLVE